MPRIARIVSTTATLALLAACGKPQPPEKEQPPEPQSGAAHTELRDAIQQPIDRAKAVEGQVQDAAEQQRAAIEAAGG